MVSRFRRAAESQRPAWAVILGGTNDLGGAIAPTDIMANLTDMYEWALAQDIRPVAVTVPSIRPGGDFEDASEASDRSAAQHDEAARWVADHIARRRTLNRLMTDYCVRREMACIDLFADTTEPNTGQLAARYSNDGLHLTTDGYRRLADLLYERVLGPALSGS